jgi:hypothetical protein
VVGAGFFWGGGGEWGGGVDVVLQVAALPKGYVVPNFNSRGRALRTASEPYHWGGVPAFAWSFLSFICVMYVDESI